MRVDQSGMEDGARLIPAYVEQGVCVDSVEEEQEEEEEAAAAIVGHSMEEESGSTSKLCYKYTEISIPTKRHNLLGELMITTIIRIVMINIYN